MNGWLDEAFSQATSQVWRRAESSIASAAALLLISVWALAGPFPSYSYMWQFTVNTATTIAIFLMIFIPQNRGAEALQIRTDVFLRAKTAEPRSRRGVSTMTATTAKGVQS